MLFTEGNIIRNIKRDTIINEQDRYSTLDKNFKKKSEGTFKFLDIHSSEAKKYLESNSYFIKNFKSILPITNGEIAISEDDDKLAGYIYIGGGDKYTNKKHGFVIIGYSSDKKDEYWMQLKSKLDKDDKIIIK